MSDKSSVKYYIADAFAEEIFKGNPAGVCVSDGELPAELMQKIAFENNLSETALLRAGRRLCKDFGQSCPVPERRNKRLGKTPKFSVRYRF